jgi:hypothetical protein
MNSGQKNTSENDTNVSVLTPDEVARNADPRANENIRVRTEEPQPQQGKPAKGVGSEITDGEDG